MAHAGHVTSSLKTFRDALARGLSSVKLFSNEEWLLTPLSRYAANAGMEAEAELFKSLKRDVQAAMARAIRFHSGGGNGSYDGAGSMNLTAQRNISVELFEAGEENVIVVGTMLDNEHLIKLEVNIFLPDEQITRSKLNMIRVPFPVCREVENVAEKLVGLRIERGVLSQIVRRVGGRVGCSHIKELATNIVYFVASHLVRRRAGFDPVGLDFVHKPAEERFALTKGLLRDSCLAYCQTTAQGLDEQIGIKRMGKEHASPVPLGDFEPSLGAVLTDRVRRYGERTYLRERRGDEFRSMTWNEFGDDVFRIARHLIAEGIRPGDRIAMLSENRSEMFLFELATVAIGAVTVPIFAGYLPRQIVYVLTHARPKWLVVSGKHQLGKIEKDRHPWVRRYFAMDFDLDCDMWGAEVLAALRADGGATQQELEQRIRAVQPDDLCVVMYTSGTTGMPKGVRLMHRNLLSQQKAVAHLWDVTEKDVVMGYLPWHHSFGGLFERFLTLYHGCGYCLDDSRGKDIERLIENWREYNPSLFFSVPRVHDLLLARCREDPEVDRTVFGGRLRFVFTAGASLPAPVEAGYRQRNIPVLEGWGLTETSPCVTLTPVGGAWKSGLVGFPIPGVRVRIDSDQEILVKGPNVMEGYLDDEEATAHVIDEDGWFHSGDLGEFTKEGLRIFGRKDGAFKLTTGEKVHPQRIENVLVNESPYINLALVLGSGKDYVAAVVFPAMTLLREWAEQRGVASKNLVEAPAVKELLADELARVSRQIEVKYQRVRRAVLIAEEPSLTNGELTPSGKVVRRAVMDHHADKIAELFSTHPDEDVIEVLESGLQKAKSA
jgi:long-subunit acyl-CoA synthetase (AMP-forming)